MGDLPQRLREEPMTIILRSEAADEIERLRTTFETLERLRSEGWCVVLKALPDDLPFVIENSRSEYDAPCKQHHVGCGKWCCEVRWMRWDNDCYRPATAMFGDTPHEAVAAAARVLKEREVKDE